MINNDNNLNEFFSSIAPIVIIALLILAWIYKHFYPEKKYKSEVAKDYGVSKYILSKWIKFHCSEKVAIKYVGEKTQIIRLSDIQPALGYPSSFPKYLKTGKLTSIMNKNDLERAFDISRSKLNRAINKIENPIDKIGMDISTYKSSNTFPPSIMNKMCNYLHDIKCYGKKPMCQNARQSLDLVAETVDYVELADIN